jgi:uncharacterized protein (TIGR03437 family)
VIRINPVPVTASTDVPEYLARFDISHALSLIFFDCPDPTHCDSPGTIYVGGQPVVSSQDIYFSQGSSVTLQAFPNPGWVFVGWVGPGNNQVVTGLQNVVTMNTPMSIYPKFAPVRKIAVDSVPSGLQVLADRATVYTPATLDWAMSTVHSVGPVSPQQDRNGKWWVFQSWSDKGAPNHAYTVGSGTGDESLVATYIPGAAVGLNTIPAGLTLKIDGYSTSLTPQNLNYFTWGVGETHHVEAPAQQTDSQGRIWKFSAWSNGGPAAQDISVPLDADVTGGIKYIATYTQVAKLSITSSVDSLSVLVNGSVYTTPCELLGDIGQQMTVSAPASIQTTDSTRLDFNGWPGGGSTYTVTLTDVNKSLAVSYHTMNRLRAASDPPDGASWRVDPVSGDGYYGTDSVVAVSLTTQPGYKFRRWDGDLSGTIPSGTVSMSSPRSVRAILDTVPYLSPTAVMNAAGTTPSTSVAAGSVISIFGANLTVDTASAGTGILPQTLAGATTRTGDRLLPLVFASPGQINAVLPDDLSEGQQPLTVSPPGQPDVRTTFTIARNAPGLFSNIFHEDGSLVTADAPARTGELFTVYGTGFGPADHPRLQGFPVPQSPDYLIVDGVDAKVGDISAIVVKAFAAPGKIGIDGVQFRLGDGTTSGPLKITINGVESNTVTLPVQ